MAKKSAKPVTGKTTKPAKKTAAIKKPKQTSGTIEKINETVLKKLQSLNIEPGLQADIQWCLGSYRYDKNPSGLFIMAEKALTVLKATAEKNSKSVTLKLITDLENAIKNR
jgi:hypothetical protein